ncbi:MAG: OB-fold nucleic acid binding domain-containing protein [Promethearchaeota archaeon]
MVTSNKSIFKVQPLFRVRIFDIVNGEFNAMTRELKSIHGYIKRVLVCGTILKKVFISSSPNAPERKSRLTLIIDDGTANIEATLFDADDDIASSLEIGDVVIISARVSFYRDNITLNIIDIKKIKNINEELYHRAEILKKLYSYHKEGKALIIENGGIIINKEEDFSEKLATNSLSEDEYDSLEEPINYEDEDSDDFNMDFETFSNSDEPNNSTTEGSNTDEQESILDGQSIKDSILQTLFELDEEDGVSIEMLKNVLGHDENVIRKNLKEMENEKTVILISKNRYRPN